MTEWIDPEYADLVAAYRRAVPDCAPMRRRGWSRRPYGPSAVVVVDRSTGVPYVSPHGIPQPADPEE